MKKTIFFIATAVLALAACNKVNVIEENLGDAIAFRPFASNLSRVASTQDVTTANISSFKVSAFNAGTTTAPYIDDITYTKDATTSTFYVNPTKATAATPDYGEEYYWPANNLDFYAYSWTDGSTPAYFATGQVAKTAYNTFTYQPNTAEADFADLVVAVVPNADKATYGGPGVPLNFRHAASKIVVKVKNTAAQLKFDVDAWKVGYLYEKGTYTLPLTSTATHYDDGATSPTLLSLNNWAYTGATQVVGHEYVSNLSSVVSVAANTSTATALAGEMILVPQTLVTIDPAAGYAAETDGAALAGTFIAVKLIIRNNDDAGTIIYGTPASGSDPASTLWAIWPIPNSNWEPGKKYIYTIDLAGGGYYETNQPETGTDDPDALDPILDNAVIKFVSVTVDEWQTQPEIDIAGPDDL